MPCIDSVILSYLTKTTDQKKVLDEYLTMWKILEEFVRKGQIVNIGISDIETEIFIQLYETAEVSSFGKTIRVGSFCIY